MTEVTEEFSKDNDYTLRIEVTRADIHHMSGGREGEVKSAQNITRIFNFLSAQMTTVTQALIYEHRGYQSGASAAISSSTIIQNFSDVQSPDEIKLMHQKLIALRGHPPALDQVLPGHIIKSKTGPLS